MNDDRLHYAVAIADLLTAAELGGFHVDIVTAAGAAIAGIPGSIRSERDGGALDQSGCSQTFRIDDAIVDLRHIAALTVHAPEVT